MPNSALLTDAYSSPLRAPCGAAKTRTLGSIEMSPSHARWWNRIRAGGLLRFVILRGVLLWAGGTFALVTVMMFFTDSRERFIAHNLGQPLTMASLLVFAGIIWGVAVWCWTDWRYRRYVAKNGVPSDAA